MGEKGDKLREAAEIADRVEDTETELQDKINEIKRSDVSQWLVGQGVKDHFDLEKQFAKEFNLSLTDSKNILSFDVKKYEIEGKDIPSLVKELRNYRRTLKGDDRVKITHSIENLIKAYSNHLDSNMDSIYWLKLYKSPLKEMNCSEDKLHKLSLVKDENTRREIVDSLCKYWEARLDRTDLSIGKEYASLTKKMTNTKKGFSSIVKKLPSSYSPKEEIKKHILDSVCEEQGISARQVHEKLPENLFKKTSPSMIVKMAKSQNITTVNGALYKFSDDIKKDIYAYTAAFLDSDGYITMDKNFNPRVGLIATGDRGKAFMLEMQKSLGMGRLHLDQKSPQNTKPINRLNFYAMDDVQDLLTKCRPHIKLKKGNADILLELIRMKKSHKKAKWYKERREELFKLMKYENHKDEANYDFASYGIDLDNISKYYDNCKMSAMDRIESIMKQNSVDDAIDELEEIVEEHDLEEDEWESVDDASDYLFEHKVKDKQEEE